LPASCPLRACAMPVTAWRAHARRRQRGSSGAGVPYCTENDRSGDMVAGFFVGIHNTCDQRMTDYIAAGESGGGDALYGFKHIDRMGQPAELTARQVHLG